MKVLSEKAYLTQADLPDVTKTITEALTPINLKVAELQKTYEEKDKAYTEHLKENLAEHQKLRESQATIEKKVTETTVQNEKKIAETAPLNEKVEKLEEKVENLTTHVKPKFQAPE